jgi:RNA polymerase sigma factor (sigma-70 family)
VVDSAIAANQRLPSLGDALVASRGQALATARRLVGHQDAEDVVQEATTRVLHAAARGAQVEQPGAYLRVAVRRAAVDHLHECRGQLPAGELPQLRDRSDVHDVVEAHEVLEAIGGLPANQRTALLNTVLGDHDQALLATRLGTTPAGVRQLVHRARLRLRTAVGAWIPWLGGRCHELVLATDGAGHGTAVALAVAAVISPPVIVPPSRPVPPPRPVVRTVPARSLGALPSPAHLTILPPAVIAPRPPDLRSHKVG